MMMLSQSSSANMTTLIHESISVMMSTEMLFLTFFCLGFYILQSRTYKPKSRLMNKKKAVAFQVDYWKSIEIEAQAGHHSGALALWRASSQVAATPSESFRFVAEAFLQVEKDQLLKEICRHIRLFRYECCNVRVAAALLEATARAGEVEMMERFMRFFCTDLRLLADLRMYDVVIGGYAAAGKEEKVRKVFKTMKAEGHKESARGFSLSIKGFLKNNLPDAALKQVVFMSKAGYQVPPFAVGQIFRANVDTRQREVFLDALEFQVPLPAEAATYLFDELCAKQGRHDLVDRIEAWARRSDVPASCGAYDWLLKHWASAGDARAIPLFDEMQKNSAVVSEGLCVGLLSRCAESKFLSFAQRIVSCIKAKQNLTITTYSALMKVYAKSNMYDQACDLYYEIIENGLEPDSTMYGCLMRFAVDCGRTQLAQDLFQKAPRLDIQNYMALIRAAGRDKDIDRAFAVLTKLQKSNVTIDLAAYNCVVDVCISVGQIDRARELIDSVRKTKKLDVVTWNTLLKGYCHKYDLEGAKAVLEEMDRDGHPPNDISFNCVINAAVSSGNFGEAWKLVEAMQAKGISPDRYTMSTLMKSMRKARTTRDVEKVLTLLDKSGLNVFSDEILLCMVVEVCMKHKETRRLHAIVDALPNVTTMKPSSHTYATMLKACSSLHDVQRCSVLWEEMVSVRRLKPDETSLGCMLEALVGNKQVDDAVDLLEKWSGSLTPNANMYSTIIQGFTKTHESDKALSMWRRMRSSGGRKLLTTATYNTAIESQTRAGAMDVAMKLLDEMSEDGVLPDASTHASIVKGYCANGNFDKALQCFKHMQTQGMIKDAVLYNGMFDACAQHLRRDVASNLLKDMEKRGLSPNSATLSTMVKLYVRLGEPDTAIHTMKAWPQRYNFAATGQTWTALICALLNEGNFDSAIAAFGEMKLANVNLDAKAYGSLMSSFVRKGHLLKALTILDEAHGMGAANKRGLPGSQWVDVEHLETLVHAVADRKGAGAAAALVDRLVAANAPLNGKVLAFGRE